MKRKTYIDIAKGIATILVIIGHCNYTNSKLVAWLYTFHMPLFFIINGLFISLNKYPTLKDFTKKKAKSLLIPYFILSIPTFICSIALEVVKTKAIDIGYIFNRFIGIFIGWRKTEFDNGMWFILALFLSDILVYMILKYVEDNKKIKNNNKIIILSLINIILFTIGVIITKFVKGFVWSIDVVPVCASFVLIGYLLNKLNDKKNIFSNNKIGILMILINVVFGYLNYKLVGRSDIHGSNLGNGFYYLLSAIAGSVFIIYLSKMINTNKILETIAKHSLSYYALQGIALPIAKNGIEFIFKILKINNINIIIWVLTIIISMIILEASSRILEKLLPKIFKK